jgi:DNA-binding beta-propeller fold protein YncE
MRARVRSRGGWRLALAAVLALMIGGIDAPAASAAGDSVAGVAKKAKCKKKGGKKGKCKKGGTFQLERSWAHSNTDGLAVDDAGTVYATDGETIRRFSTKGKLLGSWGGAGSAPGQLNDAHGLAVDLQGNVLVADYANNRIQVFSAGGGFIRHWSAPFTWSPWDLDVGPDGTVYVLDLANDALHRFAPDGTYGGGFGGTGVGDGQFDAPSGIAADRQGRYFIADTNNDRVQAFNAASGLFLTKWGHEGAGAGQFTSSRDVAVSPKGGVFVSDNTAAGGRVQQFSAQGAISGKALRSFGKGDGFDAGALLDFDARGNLYAAENTAGSQRILKFRPCCKKVKKKGKKKGKKNAN